MFGCFFISICFLKWGLNAAIFAVLIEFIAGIVIDNNLALHLIKKLVLLIY